MRHSADHSKDKPPLVTARKDNTLSDDIIREMNDREKRKKNISYIKEG